MPVLTEETRPGNNVGTTALAENTVLTNSQQTFKELTSGSEELYIEKKPVYNFFKRVFDIMASLIASVILILPMAVITIIVAVKGGGKPIYFQKRVGKNGEIIKVCKFRSMKIGADNLEEMLTPEQIKEYKKEYFLRDDPRLIGYVKKGDGTKCFGAKIRRASIDELPQIMWNILIRGNMSIVGPRPIIDSELSEYYTPEQRKVLLSVKPGLTGYWKVNSESCIGYKDGKRQEMELWYIQNRSFLVDMKIIFKTFGTVLHGNRV